MLSGQQLVEQSKEIEKFKFLSRGSKLTAVDAEAGTSIDQSSLTNLKTLLGFERISFSNKIAKGVYEQEANRVKVTTAYGKMNVGSYENGFNYLKPFEALLQIEMGRLVVSFGSVDMSLEQAYSIFLDPSIEISMEEYLVYSHLVRAGYFVYQHDFEKDKLKYEKMQLRETIRNEDEMVWCVLREKLNLPFSSNFVATESQLYNDTKKAMEEINMKISGNCSDSTNQMDIDSESSSNKRELSPEVVLPSSSSKKRKFNNVVKQKSNFLDVLKSEVEFYAYEEIFKSFSFIQRAENPERPERNLKFNFDVFTPKKNFKRTEDLPSYRLLVIK